MDDGDEGEGKGVYVDWEDGGQQKGVRGWWFGVDEFRSGETGGRNNGLVVSGLLCWRRESDDEVEREEGRRWMVGQWQIEGSGFSRVSGFRGWGKQRKRTGRRRNTRGRGGGWFTLSASVKLNRFGFYLLFSFFLTGFLSLLARFFSL